MNKNDILISMVLETLYQQEIYLTDEDKKNFPLAERCASTILDIWDTNRIKIRALDLKQIADGQLLIQVNDSARVCFITPLTKYSNATA